MATRIQPTRPKEGTRQEYSRADQIRVIKEVLTGTYTYLEACRAYKLQSNQIYAWLGKAVIEGWDEIIRAIGVTPQLVTRVAGSSDVPMIPLDDVTKFKLAIADQWLREHQGELMSMTMPGTVPASLAPHPPAVKKSDKPRG